MGTKPFLILVRMERSLSAEVMVLKCIRTTCGAWEHLAGPTPRVLDLVGLGWGPENVHV